MSKLHDFAQAVGADIKEIKGKQSSSLSIAQAYGLFPTYNNFFLQVLEQNKFCGRSACNKVSITHKRN